VLHLSFSHFLLHHLFSEPAGYPYGAAARSFRIGGGACPSPLVARGSQASRAARNGRIAARHEGACGRGH
jgi:hypothetical protein